MTVPDERRRMVAVLRRDPNPLFLFPDEALPGRVLSVVDLLPSCLVFLTDESTCAP
jgi:hypothetical protein